MNIPQTPSFSLAGKKALVIGASSGIGLGCASALVQAGALVTCVARNIEKLNEVSDSFSELGYEVRIKACDLNNPDSLRILFNEEVYDIVVNSAGIARHTPALEASYDDFNITMDVNLRAPFFISTLAASALIKQNKPGSIIHISSQMGHTGGIDRAVYCASKHGLEGMIKSMACEFGPHGIRINSICPTFVKTPLTEATFADPCKLKWIMSKIKLGRVAEVEDIMGAVVFLASDASKMMTATSVIIDGGWTAA